HVNYAAVYSVRRADPLTPSVALGELSRVLSSSSVSTTGSTTSTAAQPGSMGQEEAERVKVRIQTGQPHPSPTHSSSSSSSMPLDMMLPNSKAADAHALATLPALLSSPAPLLQHAFPTLQLAPSSSRLSRYAAA